MASFIILIISSIVSLRHTTRKHRYIRYISSLFSPVKKDCVLIFTVYEFHLYCLLVHFKLRNKSLLSNELPFNTLNSMNKCFSQSVCPFSTGLTTRTGQGALRTTFSAVPPNRICSTPVCPCVAMMMRSTFSSSAVSMISRNGLPVSTNVRAGSTSPIWVSTSCFSSASPRSRRSFSMFGTAI